MKFLFVQVVWCLFPQPSTLVWWPEAAGSRQRRWRLQQPGLISATWFGLGGGCGLGLLEVQKPGQGLGLFHEGELGAFGNVGPQLGPNPSQVVPGGRGSGLRTPQDLPAPVPPPELYLLLLVLLAGKGFATLRSLLSAAGLCLCPLHCPHV